MKKLIVIVIASLMFSNIGYAEIRQIEVKNIKGNYVSTICVDGHKFVVSKNGRSIVQFFYFERLDNKTIPAKC